MVARASLTMGFEVQHVFTLSTAHFLHVLAFSGVRLLQVSGLPSQYGCLVIRSVKSCPPAVFPVHRNKDEGGGVPYQTKPFHEC